MMERTQAKEELSQLSVALNLGEVLTGKREDNVFNLYVAAGKRGEYRISLAVRRPKSGATYAALKRSAGGRNVVEDRVDIEHWPTIREAFVSSVAMQRLGTAVSTTTNVDEDEIEG